jgi:hypothetical protein
MSDNADAHPAMPEPPVPPPAVLDRQVLADLRAFLESERDRPVTARGLLNRLPR